MISVRTITIPYKNDSATLRRCLESLRDTVGVTLVPVIVDNAPTDENRALVAEILPQATYHASPYNLGFSKAVNIGLDGFAEDFALLVNPDTAFDANVIAQLAERMTQDGNVGVGSVVIRNEDGTLQPSIRRFPTLIGQIMIMLKLPHLMKRVPFLANYVASDADHARTHDVDSIMGAFMMIPKSIIERVGGFDEGYFLWFEEVDYCKMVVDAGYSVRHYADLSVTHVRGQSFGKVRTLTKQRWARNSFAHYLQKHHGALAATFWRCWYPIFTILAIGADVIVEARRKLRKALS